MTYQIVHLRRKAIHIEMLAHVGALGAVILLSQVGWREGREGGREREIGEQPASRTDSGGVRGEGDVNQNQERAAQT